MRKFLNYAMYASLLLLAFSFTACQSEFEELPQEDNKDSIMASSSTAELIERTVSNDGSYDNIVDGSSCFNIRFPYTVEVNGLEIKIDAKEDINLIEAAFDAIEDDEDFLEILFPITVTLADYTEITINGINDLRELAKQCVEGGADDDIECIDFAYPISIFTFDTDLTETGNVTIESDKEMRRFFAGLDDNDLVSFDFPIVLNLYDGTEVSVSSNAELAAAIESVKEACDEDDDDDFNDDDFTKELLDNLLAECPWLIKEVKRNEVNQTDQYFDYLMSFTEDGKVTAQDQMGNIINGTWNTRVADNGALLKMEFDVLVDFSLEWIVYELEPGRIKLYVDGGNRIIMKSACDIFNNEPDTLREILKECSWIIKKVKINDEEIRRLLGYEFKFMPEGVVTLSNGDVTSEGSWEINKNERGRLVMGIIMGDEPNVSFEWLLSDLRNDRLKFSIEGTFYELILQRDCDGNDDGDVMEIRSVLLSGDWIVAKYTEGENDKTENYAAYTFAVEAEHLLNITNGETAISQTGSWRVLRNSDGKLKVYLNAGEEDPLGELTEDWYFVSITDNRIELKDKNDDGSYDMLVFEKK